jgi:serine/threonine-protein kinase
MEAVTATLAGPVGADVLPRRFGRYQLFDRIGRGGMAEIYLARAHTELGADRLVVVKQILPELAGDPAFAKLLVDEAKLAARLRHANVVQVYDLGREDGQLFIAMEYVEGYDLHQLLRELSRQRVPLPAEFALLLVRETLEALSYAHRARDEEGRPLGIVHRDVSPSNVLVSLEGEVKLCDFGIARALASASPAGAASPGARQDADDDAGASGEREAAEARGRVVGKSAYMSPEQARGEPLDARSDVYAAGILLWELCAGRRMIRGTEQEMLAQARAGIAPELPDRGLPEHGTLAAIVARALATRPEDRFASAQEMARAIDRYTASAGLVGSPLRFAELLRARLDATLFVRRRERERAARALDRGPPAVLTPLPSGSPQSPGSPASGGLADGAASGGPGDDTAPTVQQATMTPDEAAALLARARPAGVEEEARGAAEEARGAARPPDGGAARSGGGRREGTTGTVVAITLAALAVAAALAFLWAGR